MIQLQTLFFFYTVIIRINFNKNNLDYNPIQLHIELVVRKTFENNNY